MSKTIELPDPLYAEIDGYAHRAAVPTLTVIRQAWEEFQRHHPQGLTPPASNLRSNELLNQVRALRGSISLPHESDDRSVITEARLEKYGPL